MSSHPIISNIAPPSATLEGPKPGGGGGGGCGNGGEGERRGSGSQPPRVPVHREVYQSLQRTSIHTTSDQRHQHHHPHQHPQHGSHHPQHPQVIPSTSSANPLHTSHTSQRRLSKTSQQLSSSSHPSSQYQQKHLYTAAAAQHQTTHHQNHIQKSLSKGSSVDEKLCNTKLEVTTCCCFSPRCHREHGSLFATLLGSISLTCLLAAIVTDTWIHTEDVVTVPLPFGRESKTGNPTKIEFTIGLWKVCPKFLQTEKDIIRSTSLLSTPNLREGKLMKFKNG